jgi:hypothetical protein
MIPAFVIIPTEATPIAMEKITKIDRERLLQMSFRIFVQRVGMCILYIISL